MSKVFEALQRQQRNQNAPSGERDPLAAEIGAPDAGQALPEEDIDGAENFFELPSLIGAPTGPRSNDGMILPSANAPAVSPSPRADARDASREERPPREEASAAPSPAREKRRADFPVVPHEIPIERLSLTALHPRLIMFTEPGAPECEQYRTLRTQIFHAAEKKPTQVIVVSSAVAGEGKTSTVLNLALAIAQSKEKRVLVIDGDLRRPNVAAYLGARPKIGLEQVLEGKRGAFDSLICLEGVELYLLPVGREAKNPTELLSSDRLDAMIEEFRAYFDFILIDSPPVLPFADARLLANHSDAVVMVVRAGMAPYETVEKAIEVVSTRRILGVVLNDADPVGEVGYYDYYSYSDREQRRRSFWEVLKGSIRGSWLGKRMHLD